jgi:hypothetical protein
VSSNYKIKNIVKVKKALLYNKHLFLVDKLKEFELIYNLGPQLTFTQKKSLVEIIQLIFRTKK